MSYNVPAIFLVWGDLVTARDSSRWTLAVQALDGERLSGTVAVLAWATLVLDGPQAALDAMQNYLNERLPDATLAMKFIKAQGI